MAQIKIRNKTFQVPDPESPCSLWITYHKSLKKTIGKENAKTVFLITWQKNGSTSCTTKPDFNSYFKKQGIDVSNAATRAIADLSTIGGNVLGMGKNLSKIVSIGTPILLGSIAITVVILLINTAKRGDVTDLAALHPVGRASKGLKLLK